MPKKTGWFVQACPLRWFPFTVVLIALCTSQALAWQGSCLTVLSGRSFVAAPEDGVQVRVDLYGLGVPDRVSSPTMWRESRNRLASVLKGIRLTIEDVRVAKGGARQSLVYLEGDGECVNEEMVRSGHAWVDPMQCKLLDCGHWYELEKQAQGEQKGMWARQKRELKGLDLSGKPDEGTLSGCPGCQLR
jgi:endonuclease YncB( thermonuclease family)